MKHYKKASMLVLACLTVLAVFITSCEKEEISVEENSKISINSLKSNSTFSVLKSKDIEKDEGLMRIIKKSEKKVSDGKTGKTVYNEQYDFTINTDYAKVITRNDGFKNYTFGVYREVDNGLLENLLLEEQEDGTFIVSLVEYNLTPTERETLINQEIVEVDDKINFVLLEDISDSIFDKVNADAETCTIFSYEYQQGSSCTAGGGHSYSDGNACSAWGNANYMATSGGYVLTGSEVDCGTSGTGEEGSTTTTGTTGTTSGGYGSNGGETDPIPDTTPVLCTDCPDISEIEEDCPPVPDSIISVLNDFFGEGNYVHDCDLTSDETINISSAYELEALFEELLLGEAVEVQIPNGQDTGNGFLREDIITKKFSSFPQTEFVVKMKMLIPSNPSEVLKPIYADVGLEGNLTIHDWTQTDNGDPLLPDGFYTYTDYDINSLISNIDGEMLIGLNIGGHPFKAKKFVTFVVSYDIITNLPKQQYCYWHYTN